MRLTLQGVIETGVGLLDSGITDLEVAVVDGTLHLYSSTGRNGGLVDYVVGAEGGAEVGTSVIFPPEITAIVSDRIVLADDGTGLVLLVGNAAQGLVGYLTDAGGNLGAQVLSSLTAAEGAATDGSIGHIEALVVLADASLSLFPAGFDCTQLVELVSITLNGQSFLLGACGSLDGVVGFRVDPGTGQLIQTGTMGMAQGLGVHLPTAIEVVEIAGQAYVLLAASGSSSISVMRLGLDGALTPTDHVVDTGITRFEGVQALGVAQSGDHVFVVAGGADNGLTLFRLLPDGRLIALQSLGDTALTAMHKVTAVSLAIEGDLLHVFVGSQNESGVTHFTLDLSNLGIVLSGTAAAETLAGGGGDDVLMASGAGDTLLGGAGDDILVTGQGQTVMTGGAGADTFVIRDGAGGSTVTDFQRGTDRLDLSDLPMLRDPAQLSVTATGSGCIVSYRGTMIVVTAADGRPLTLADLFPGGFDWADHFPFVPQEPVTPLNPGVRIKGTDLRDTLTGTDRDDTLLGGLGHDTLIGGAGNDSLDGGNGRDLLTVTDGANLLLGGAGADTLRGGIGADTLDGGDGRDLIQGGAGNDLIYGGNGADTLAGGEGDDTLRDSGGRNLLYCGAGNDDALGGADSDQIYGGQGDDLVDGGGGNDTVGGGTGNDTVRGGAGDDLLFGKSGNDWMKGGAGADEIWGGDGADTLDGGDGHDLIYGGAGDDQIFGGSGSDRLWGKDGDDLIDGGSWNDLLWGDAGNDTLIGGTGDDWLSGGDGDDLLQGDEGNDVMRGGRGTDTFVGGAGADVFEYFRDHDTSRIMDFHPGEGDALRIDDWTWHMLGTLSAQEVVDRFGLLDADGNVVLDFTGIGSGMVILDGFHDLSGLAGAIDIV